MARMLRVKNPKPRTSFCTMSQRMELELANVALRKMKALEKKNIEQVARGDRFAQIEALPNHGVKVTYVDEEMHPNFAEETAEENVEDPRVAGLFHKKLC